MGKKSEPEFFKMPELPPLTADTSADEEWFRSLSTPFELRNVTGKIGISIDTDIGGEARPMPPPDFESGGW